MPKELLIYLPYFVFGGIISIQDWKTKQVKLSQLTLFFLACLLVYSFNNDSAFIIPIIFFAVGGFAFFIKNKIVLGIADYIVVVAISLILKSEDLPKFLIFCGIFGLISHIIKKSETIPFIPTIFISTNLCMML